MKLCDKHPELNGKKTSRQCVGCKRQHERDCYAPVKAANAVKRIARIEEARLEKEIRQELKILLRPTVEDLKRRRREYKKKYRQSQAGKQERKRYKEKYPEKKAHHRRVRWARQRAAEKQAVVDLTPAEKKKVSDLYREARRRTKETGEQHNVHHIKALANGGLHHPDNMEAIPAWLDQAIVVSNRSGLDYILS